MTGRAGKIILALALAAGVLTGCTQAGEDTSADRRIPFTLYAHCGIKGARVGSTYFEAEIPLSDGSGNLPEGWGNLFQRGTMTLMSETETVFTDNAGHEVKFRVRPARAPPNLSALSAPALDRAPCPVLRPVPGKGWFAIVHGSGIASRPNHADGQRRG